MSLLAYIGDLPGRVENRIREFIERFGPRWLYVDWSGGKDSTAVLAAAVRCCRDMVVATFLHLAGQTLHVNAQAVLEAARRLGLRIYRYTGLRHPRQLRQALARDRPWEEAPALVYVVTTARGMDYWAATLRYGLEAPLERLGGGKRWACAMMKNEWLAERPPNGLYQGRPARFIAVGIRRSESPYRARLWEGRLWQVFGTEYQREPDVALAPIVDLSEEDVWALLRRYGLYDVVKRQYTFWKRAPNCALCPLMARNAIREAVRGLPTGYLLRAKKVLEAVRPRYREGTYSAKKIDEMLEAINEELARRGVTDEHVGRGS